MSDVVTYSAKLDSDTRDRLQTLIEQSGLPARDFLSRLVGLYEASEAQGALGHIQEIETLRHHLGRIEEIYVALVKGAVDQKEADGAAFRGVTEELTAAKAAALDARNEAAALVDAAQAEAARARQQAEADIQAMRDLVETANKEVEGMRDALARARDSQQQSARLAALAEEAATAAKNRCAELEDAAARAEEYHQDAQRARDEAAQAHAKAEKDVADIREAMARATRQAETEKERAAERAEIETGKAVLTVKEEKMNAIAGLRDALAQTREELSQVKATLEVARAVGHVTGPCPEGTQKREGAAGGTQIPQRAGE